MATTYYLKHDNKLLKFNDELLDIDIEEGGGGAIPTDYEFYWSFDADNTDDDSGNGWKGVFYDATRRDQATYPASVIGDGFKPNVGNPSPGASDRTGLIPATQASGYLYSGSTPYNLPASPAYSIAFFYKYDDSPFTQDMFLWQTKMGTHQFRLQIQHSSPAKGTLDIRGYAGGGAWEYDNDASPMVNGTTYALCLTFDGVDGWKLYKDDVEVCSLTKALTLANANNVILMNAGGSPGDYFGGACAGDVDQVRFYERV